MAKSNPIDAILGDAKFINNKNMANPIDSILSSSLLSQPPKSSKFAPYGTTGIGPYLSEVANAAREFANTAVINPINAANRLATSGLNQVLGTNIQASQLPNYQMELPNTSSATVGKITGDILGFIPSIESGGAIANSINKGPLAAQVIGNALYQGSQAKGDSKDILRSGGEGALLGYGGNMLGNAISKSIKPVARYLSSKAVSPLMEKAQFLFKERLPQNNETIATELGKAYQLAKSKISNWEKTLLPFARKIDQEGVPFNSNLFKDNAESVINQYKSKFDRLPAKYGPAKEELEYLINNLPKSYEDAIIVNERINSIPNTWNETNDAAKRVLKDVSSKMNRSLKEQIDKNALENPSVKEFSDEWKNNLQNYKFFKSFSQLPVGKTKDGLKLSYKKSLAEKIENTDIPDEDISNHFMPTSREDGTLKMEHLANLLENKNKAARLLKDEYFKNATSEGIFDPRKALNNYSKLSDSQRNFIFTNDENKLFKSAAKAKKISEKDKILMPFILRYGSKINPLYIGGGLGAAAFHEHPFISALGGMSIASAVPYGMEKIANKLANPEGINLLYRLSEKGLNPNNFNYASQAVINPFFANIKNQRNDRDGL